MFHIKPDKRSETSASLIVEGLYDCLNEKPFSKITITDVQKASTVGRATFYRLFDSLSDVLSYECDNIFQRVVARGREKHFQVKQDAFVFFFSTWMSNERLLNVIVESGHIEIINTVFRKYAWEIGSIMSPDEDFSEAEGECITLVISLCMAGILETWIKQDKKQTPQDLTELFYKTMSAIYRSL